MSTGSKITTHNHAQNIGQLHRDRMAAGQGFFVMSLEHGYALEAAQWAHDNPDLPIHIVLRYPVIGEDEQPDIPRYWIDPKIEGPAYWSRLLHTLRRHVLPYTPTHLRQYIKIAVMNETRPADAADEVQPTFGGMHPFDHAAAVALHVTKELEVLGFGACVMNFYAGHPETELWDLPHMLALFEHVALNRQHALGFHEGYSIGRFPAGDIQDEHPHMVGRWRHVYDVADHYDLPVPNVCITEFAFTNHLDRGKWLDYGRVERDMVWVMNHAYNDDALLGVAIYTAHNDPNAGRLPDAVRGLVPTLRNLAFNYTYEEPPPYAPPTTPPDTGEPMPEPTDLADALEGWLDSRPHFFYEAALHAAIVKDGNWPLTLEERETFDGQRLALQGARTPDDSRRYIYYTSDGDWSSVKRHQHRRHGPPPPPPQPTIPPPPVADGFPFDRLRLHAPALKRGARQDFQAFGAPREYDLNNDGKPEPFYHEGLDVTTYWADPVYAAYDGIVQTIRNNPGGWGHYLWIEHEIDGHPFHTAYCHLSADYVEEGQHVKAGEKIAAAGNTGNVFPKPTPDDPYRGTHLHFTLQVWEHGKTGGMWVPQHVVNPEPFIDWNTAAPPPPVTPGPKYDLAGYIAGDRVVRLANSRGTRELCWYKRVGNMVYFVKNTGYEELSWDANSVYRGVDTTQGGGLGYCQYSQPGRKWAIWIPRHVAVGESFSRSPYVVHKRLSDCTVTAQGWHTSTITVVAHHTRYTVPESGQQVGNTIVLQGAQHGEQYWYAYGLGLVRFSGPGFVSWLHEVVDQERGDEPVISRCF